MTAAPAARTRVWLLLAVALTLVAASLGLSGTAVAAAEPAGPETVGAEADVSAGQRLEIGSVSYDLSSGSRVATSAADDVFDTGGARFVVDSRGAATDLGPRVSPGRPVVIGEDMSGRVFPAADDFAADAYRPPVLSSDRASMAHNRYWVNEQMNQGRGVIDVGPAPGRTNFPEPTSPWYIMEREQIAQRNYPYYVQRQR